VKTTFGIPDPLGKLGVLEKRVSPRGVKWRHAHVHAAKGEDAAETFSPEILRCAGVDAFERMQCEEVSEKGRPRHGEERCKVLPKHLFDTDLIVAMGFLQKP